MANGAGYFLRLYLIRFRMSISRDWPMAKNRDMNFESLSNSTTLPCFVLVLLPVYFFEKVLRFVFGIGVKMSGLSALTFCETNSSNFFSPISWHFRRSFDTGAVAISPLEIFTRSLRSSSNGSVMLDNVSMTLSTSALWRLIWVESTSLRDLQKMLPSVIKPWLWLFHYNT